MLIKAVAEFCEECLIQRTSSWVVMTTARLGTWSRHAVPCNSQLLKASLFNAHLHLLFCESPLSTAATAAVCASEHRDRQPCPVI